MVGWSHSLLAKSPMKTEPFQTSSFWMRTMLKELGAPWHRELKKETTETRAYIYIYTCGHICTWTPYIYIYIYIYIHCTWTPYIYNYMYIYAHIIYVYVCICIYTCILYTWGSLCMYDLQCNHTHIYIYIHMYDLHIPTQNNYIHIVYICLHKTGYMWMVTPHKDLIIYLEPLFGPASGLCPLVN